MKSAVFEGKVLDDVINSAVKYFHQDKDLLVIDILEQKKGILGFGAFIKAKVTLNIDPVVEGKNYLTQLMNELNIDGEVVVTHKKTQINYALESNANGFLIGRDGSALRAIQLLTTTVVNQYSDEQLNVLVDVGGYKQRQVKRLEKLAFVAAKETLNSKIDAKLDPMNAFERRVIHNALADWKHIKTVSEGVTPDRYIVIKYVR